MPKAKTKKPIKSQVRTSAKAGSKNVKSKKLRITLAILGLTIALVGGFVVYRSFASEAKLVNPTHFYDIWYGYNGLDKNNINSLFGSSVSGDITILGEATGVPVDKQDGYFESLAIYMKAPNSNKTEPSYIGLQNSGRFMASNIYNKRAIFSMWGNCSATSTGYAGKFTHENSGCQAAISYDWKVGTRYTLKIIRESCSNQSCVWRGEVINRSNNTTSVIGKITSNYKNIALESGGVYFHERWSGPISSCDLMQYSKANFSNLKAIDAAGSLHSAFISNSKVSPVCSFNHKLVRSEDNVTTTLGVKQTPRKRVRLK